MFRSGLYGYSCAVLSTVTYPLFGQHLIGESLGPYKILEPLGAGGMGEVYLGEDTRLDRKVAIKVLPEEYASDPERLARFEQEAKAAAALNHPHIAVVHDIGYEDGGESGIHYMVQEYLEGQSLRQRLDKGVLPLDEALDLASEVAEALIAAHKASIIHRDLKPDNIFVTEEGHAKVLDFGLAKLTEAAAPTGSSASMSPTMLGTVAGQVMGTAGYMAPEQINGEEVDQRADLFAFGCVLYGMVTGRQAFAGKNVHDTLGRILSEEPEPVAAADKSLPAEVQRIVRKALAKDVKRRYQTAGDLNADLLQLQDDIAAGTATPVDGQPVVAPMAVEAARGNPWKLVTLAAVAGGIVTAAIVWMARPDIAPGGITRFPMALEEGQAITTSGRRAVSISPDGARVAYVVDRELRVRSMSALTPTVVVAGQDRKTDLVFSPNSRLLAYADFVDRAIKTVEVSGSAPVTVCPLEFLPYGITWTGEWLLYGVDGAILRVPATGGEPEVLIDLDEGDVPIRPQLLPDGRSVLFTLVARNPGGGVDWSAAKVVVYSLDSAEQTTLVEGGADARYLPSGHLLYMQSGVLFARSFDAARPEQLGGAVSIVEGVLRPGGGAAEYDVSDTGTLVYVPGPVDASTTGNQSQLALFDRSGDTDPLNVPPGPFFWPRMSPDGRHVAFGRDEEEESSVWVFDLTSGDSARRLSFGGRDRYPVWSHDSERVAFQSDREGDLGIFWQRADGTDTTERLTEPEADTAHVPQSFSPDGSVLLLDARTDSSTTLLELTISDGSIKPFGDVESPATGTSSGAVFSPDGYWVAYTATDPAQGTRVFVQPYPATGARHQLSGNDESGHHPVWSADGTELFYTPSPGPVIVGLNVSTAAGLTFGPAPVVARPFRNASPRGERPYDSTRDGGFVSTMFYGTTDAGTTIEPVIQVVLNWFEELQERVPVGR